MVRVSALVPAKNEEDLVAVTCRELSRLENVDEVVVVDDGSTDRTASRVLGLKEPKVRLIMHANNLGKGEALNTASRRASGDIFLLADADLGRSACKLDRLLVPVLGSEVDMVIAVFPEAEEDEGGFGLVRRLASAGIRLFTGYRPREPLSGQRAVSRELVEDVGGFESGFGTEVALTIDALRAGYTIDEKKLTLTHRSTGRNFSGFYHRGIQFLAVCRVLLKRIWSG